MRIVYGCDAHYTLKHAQNAIASHEGKYSYKSPISCSETHLFIAFYQPCLNFTTVWRIKTYFASAPTSDGFCNALLHYAVRAAFKYRILCRWKLCVVCLVLWLMFLWLKHTYLRNVLTDTLKSEIYVNLVQYLGRLDLFSSSSETLRIT